MGRPICRGPRDAAEGHDRSCRPISPEQFAQRQGAADGVRIGIMLQQDVNLPAVRKQRANSFDFLDVQGIEELRGTELFEDIGQLQMAQ